MFDMHSATIRQCAILVGGLGTRLGERTATVPKPLLQCGDRPFLAWLMRELVRFGVEDFVLLTGHLSDVVEKSLPELAGSLPKHVQITCSREPFRAGTGGALFHARHKLADRFLLANGDSMVDFNLARLLADAAQDNTTVIGRMLLRQLNDASRYGVAALHGDRIVSFSQPTPGVAGTINAGIYVFHRDILDHVTSECSLETEVLPRLATDGALNGTIADGYFIDIGVPSDLERAQIELPQRLHRRAAFLDRDGVINIDHGWVGTRERFDWMPGALDAIAAATDAGLHVFVVTNQSGVARGFYDEAQFGSLNEWMIGQIRQHGGNVDDWRHCPFHPDAVVDSYRRVSDWRKPGAGMLLDLMAKWDVDAARSFMIGDQPSDLEAAGGANIAAYTFDGSDLLGLMRSLLARHGGSGK